MEKCGLASDITGPIRKAPTFEVYVDQWMNTYKVGKLRPKTLKGHNDKIKCHLLPAFGNVPLTEITTDKVQAMLNERKNYSHKTLQEILTLQRQILNSAVSDKLIDANPAADKRIYNPSRLKNERETLTFDQWLDVVNSLLYDNGTDVKTIQSLVGHADYSTTMNTYVHDRYDRKQAVMAKINDQINA